MSSTRPPIEDLKLRMPDDMDVRHCYRHPDRETGVSCSNCGRPICHECMIPAAVGFRCPDCVAQQRRRGNRARVVTRSDMRRRWQGGVLMGAGATVTRTLIALNFFMFVVEVLLSHGQISAISTKAALDLGGLFTPDIAIKHEYWRLLAAMFLHQGLFHVGINMLSLYFIGSVFEEVAGRGKFLALYLVSGLAGNVLVFAVAPVYSVTVGASTAIFGIFGALFVYVFRNRSAYPNQVLGQLAFWMTLNLVITFTNASISWQGHIGGLIGGVATVELLTRFGRRPLRTPFVRNDVLAVLAVLAVLVVIVVWRTHSFVA
jgi:membrane associated rhomboid family serine protease